jgi:hypothetical protein
MKNQVEGQEACTAEWTGKQPEKWLGCKPFKCFFSIFLQLKTRPPITKEITEQL